MIDPAVRPAILTAFANNDESLGSKYSHRISELRRTLGELHRVEAMPTRSDEKPQLQPERFGLRESHADDLRASTGTTATGKSDAVHRFSAGCHVPRCCHRCGCICL